MTLIMMIRKYLLLILFIFISATIFSQDKDFGLWAGFDARHRLIKNLDIEGSAWIRSGNNASQIEKSYIEGGLRYKFNKFYSVAGYYRVEGSLEDDSDYYLRHKLFFDLKIANSSGNFNFSGRFRFQRGTKNYIEDEEDLLAKYYWRFKFKTEYDIPSFPLSPYAYFETFSPLFAGSGFSVDKERFSAGADLKINTKNSISIEYIYQKYLIRDMSVNNIISINYKIIF